MITNIIHKQIIIPKIKHKKISKKLHERIKSLKIEILNKAYLSKLDQVLLSKLIKNEDHLMVDRSKYLKAQIIFKKTWASFLLIYLDMITI